MGLVAFFNDRDESTTSVAGAGPGTSVPTSGGGADVFLRAGNVRIVVPGPGERRTVLAMAREVAGDPPDSAALRRSGQAIEVALGTGARDIGAFAYRRVLRTSDPSDPALREFVEYWLGRGAQG